MTSTTRIARNTLFLYFRQILIMLVSLYTVRVVLNVLGAEDYGIYSVVAGVVTMFGFLSGAMATASQRYFSFDLGRGDTEHLEVTFSVTLQIYLLIALAVAVLAETLGLWLVNRKLVIPPERMAAANCIYQAAVVSFILTLLASPYMAAIIAHENMNVYAYASIAEAAMKLGVVFLLRALPFDKLSLYGMMLAAVALVNTGIYRLYCRRRYAECRLRLVRDGRLLREIAGYSGWNLFGSTAWMIKNQGCSVLLNLFLGPTLNAAQGIATSVKNTVWIFSSNFMQSVRPQIVKSYAAEDYDALWKVVFFGCKCAYFLLLVIVIPIYGNIGCILSIWLKEIPDFTISFLQLLLVELLVQSVGEILATVNQATGKIALYQFLIGMFIFLNFPFSYAFLRFGFPPYYVYFVGIAFTFCMTLIRILFLLRIPCFSLVSFILKVILPIILSSIILFFMAYLIRLSAKSFLLLVLDISIKFLVSCIVIILIGFSKSEKKKLMYLVCQFLHRNGVVKK